MNNTYHYPPEVLELLADTIAHLIRSKPGVLIFFRGAGVREEMIADLNERVYTDRENISKYEIAQTILVRLNEKGDNALAQRREIIKRVTEWEDFSTCWEKDRLKAYTIPQKLDRQIR